MRKLILVAENESSGLADFAAHFGLTPRQLSVLALLVDGVAPKEIADRLCIAHVTVRRHAEDLYRKCGITNQRELLALLTRMLMRPL